MQHPCQPEHPRHIIQQKYLSIFFSFWRTTVYNCTCYKSCKTSKRLRYTLTEPEQQATPLFLGGSGGASPTRSGDGTPLTSNKFSSL